MITLPRPVSLCAVLAVCMFYPCEGNSHDEVECDSDEPLGMVSGAITDSQITGSSVFSTNWALYCEARYARLYLPNGLSWCPGRKASSEWLQVDLGVMTHITGVMTQGRSDGREWVTQFRLSYSEDGIEDHFIVDSYGNQQLFEGNVDSYTVKHNYLEQPVKARFIKFHIYTWHEHPSLRVEILGCQRCNRMLALPPYTRLAASTAKGKRNQKSCTEEYGHLYSNKAWCAKKNDTSQYLEFDIGPPTLITGVVTKGRGDVKEPQWVKKYRISYGNDSQRFSFYREESNSYRPMRVLSAEKNPLPKREGVDKVFIGNTDHNTAVIHYLKHPFVARFVRFHPLEWESRIAMRAGLIGCPHRGECGQGYLRINNQSNCVANLAFKKEAWLHSESSRHMKKRHSSFTDGSWSSEAGGDDATASRAVDGVWPVITPTTSSNQLNSIPRGNSKNVVTVAFGKREELLNNCTLLEHKWPFGAYPAWHVDLRKEMLVYGIIIHTPGDPDVIWNQSLMDFEQRRLKNLDRLIAHVGKELGLSNEGDQMNSNPNKEKSRDSKSSLKICGEVTRVKRAVFQPRIHIPCHHPIRGRYVKIEATGLQNTWDKNFAAALCEVMVY